ncbi:hypothetical protein [Gulosibacter sp. 10]|uniref:hypothetical protein n=1 Tax=Gulosibacter sp. 10 TaxID=1255570 RepID=UPI00097E963B|nr:hypothetical protein [Gulosibacter sp. 10]SJM63704.1 hypothetical protein FM112_09395 [Gulosibacter sp. 10]
MSPRDYEFRPPEPRFGKQAEPDAEVVLRPAKRPLGLLTAAVLSGAVVLGLVIALVLLWGEPTQPEAQGQGAGAPGASPGESAPPDPELIGPDATHPPHDVAAGDYVPIDVDARFPEGVTLVPPEYGDWSQQDIINRPDQFTAVSPDYSATIEVWQTGVFDTPQSDEALTVAQLNRVTDECGDVSSWDGQVRTHVLEGEDGTELEMLVAAIDCGGGELWLVERVMPLTGARFHIVLWDAYGGIEENEELLEKLDEVSFSLEG